MQPSRSNPRPIDEPRSASVLRFSLAGLVVFSLALMAGTAFLTYELTSIDHRSQNITVTSDGKDKGVVVRSGPWGELLERNILLQRPAEYLTDEVAHPPSEWWAFSGLAPADARASLVQAGLGEAQATEVIASGHVVADSGGTRLEPSAEFVLAIGAETRRRLYVALAGRHVNPYIDYPYIFPRDSLESVYTDARLNPEDIAMLKRLIYPNGGSEQLSDYQLLLARIPTLDRRSAMASALSRQYAVLGRLYVKPDSDIDKIAAYWGHVPGVRFTDTRPLLESLKQLPEGGSISLLYFLPRFARERLYTFPLPSRDGDPLMDCHWSTFNFSNEVTDDRFNDPQFVSRAIRENYYAIGSPTRFGDIVLLVDEAQHMKHSAVHVADDVVFTKNGNNASQPWMLMHLPDLLATYPATPPLRVVYLRDRSH